MNFNTETHVLVAVPYAQVNDLMAAAVDQSISIVRVDDSNYHLAQELIIEDFESSYDESSC